MAGRRGLFVRKDATAGTSPQDARLAIAGLVTGAGDLGVAPGVISGCAVTGNASWQYTVSAGHLVATRGASDGATVFAVDGPTNTPAVAAAPASGSRYDLIWVRQRDIDNGDADSLVQVGVTSGTASGSPARPTAQVPSGAVVLAEALVSAGATQTAHAGVTITPVATRVAARGGVIAARTTAELAAAAALGTADAPVYVDFGGDLYRAAGGTPTFAASRSWRLESVPYTARPGMNWATYYGQIITGPSGDVVWNLSALVPPGGGVRVVNVLPWGLQKAITVSVINGDPAVFTIRLLDGTTVMAGQTFTGSVAFGIQP